MMKKKVTFGKRKKVNGLEEAKNRIEEAKRVLRKARLQKDTAAIRRASEYLYDYV